MTRSHFVTLERQSRRPLFARPWAKAPAAVRCSRVTDSHPMWLITPGTWAHATPEENVEYPSPSLGDGRRPAGRRRDREGSLSLGHSRGRPRRHVGRGGRPRSGEDGRPLQLRGGGRGDGPRRPCRRPPDHWTVRVSSQTSGQSLPEVESLHPENSGPTALDSRAMGRTPPTNGGASIG